eukprot:Amastigsp_a843318_215.p1 type:complete len:383 gc:universal Amastigsp_a843318_215:231-1379(+)
MQGGKELNNVGLHRGRRRGRAEASHGLTLSVEEELCEVPLDASAESPFQLGLEPDVKGVGPAAVDLDLLEHVERDAEASNKVADVVSGTGLLLAELIARESENRQTLRLESGIQRLKLCVIPLGQPSEARHVDDDDDASEVLGESYLVAVEVAGGKVSEGLLCSGRSAHPEEQVLVLKVVRAGDVLEDLDILHPLANGDGFGARDMETQAKPVDGLGGNEALRVLAQAPAAIRDLDSAGPEHLGDERSKLLVRVLDFLAGGVRRAPVDRIGARRSQPVKDKVVRELLVRIGHVTEEPLVHQPLPESGRLLALCQSRVGDAEIAQKPVHELLADKALLVGLQTVLAVLDLNALGRIAHLAHKRLDVHARIQAHRVPGLFGRHE